MPVRRVAKPKKETKRNKTAKTTGNVTEPKMPVEGKYYATYKLFTEYMALPTVVRSEVFKNPETGEGLETQKDFAKAYDIEETRLSEYKRTEEYQDQVSKIRRQYFRGQIGDAIQAVLTNILINPRGADLKVILEYAGEVQKDDPTGEVGEQLASILKKLNTMIPG